MERIKDVVCHSKDRKEDKYYTKDSYAGRIIIYDNHKFEGVVCDYYNDSMQLVYGVISNGEVRLYRSAKDDEELTKVYRGKRTSDKRYEGKMSVASMFVEMPLAESKVLVIEPDTYREFEFDKEKKKIKEAVSIMKKELGKEAQEIYEDVFYPELHKELEKKAQNK